MSSEKRPHQLVDAAIARHLNHQLSTESLIYYGGLQAANAAANGEIAPSEDQLSLLHNLAERVVFVADARAKCEQLNGDPALEWAVVARRSFRTTAVAAGVPLLADLTTSRLFGEQGGELQRAIYHDMCGKRDRDDSLANISRSIYATHVALGEIYLPRR